MGSEKRSPERLRWTGRFSRGGHFGAGSETAKEVGIPIPAIPVEASQEYSGKLTVRIAPGVHRDAAQIAKAEKVSLTQYISDAIVNWNAHNTAASLR